MHPKINRFVNIKQLNRSKSSRRLSYSNPLRTLIILLFLESVARKKLPHSKNQIDFISFLPHPSIWGFEAADDGKIQPDLVNQPTIEVLCLCQHPRDKNRGKLREA